MTSVQQQEGTIKDRRSTLSLFPGQGSQVIGMGRKSVETSKSASEFFSAASGAIGCDLRELCWKGPMEILTKTENTQIALTAVAIADWMAMRENIEATAGRSSDACAGHSVGALAAAVAAGFLSPIDGVRLAQIRGNLMSEAPNGGSMLAVANAIAAISEDELVECAVGLAREFDVDVAALNSPKQFVLSGKREHLDKLCQKPGIVSKMLNVSNAFHSRYMKPVAPKWIEAINTVAFTPGTCSYIGCTTATPTTDVDSVRLDLIQGLTKPVHWFGVMEKTVDLACIDVFGPGQAIARFARSHLHGRPLTVYGGGR